MPDRRHHRGPGPEDDRLFNEKTAPVLAEAVEHLSWHLTHEYAPVSALKLVGDRFTLKARQRLAVARCACSDQAYRRRNAHVVSARDVNGARVLVDGYNVLTTIEASLSGAVILHARDGVFRDIVSMHGSYRKVEETVPAIQLVGGFLHECGVAEALWYFDRPVSNSGRLKSLLLEIANERHWPWDARLVNNPDIPLIESGDIACTADSVILDAAERWFNLARHIVETRAPNARIFDLSRSPTVYLAS